MTLVVTPVLPNLRSSEAARLSCTDCPRSLVVRGVPRLFLASLIADVERSHSCSN